jgi:hypothetical protein
MVQGSYHPGSRHLQDKESVQFTRINAGQRAYTLILAIVPPCAGECRLVRVTGVLIFANARTCVAFVLLATDPLNQRADAASGPFRTRRPCFGPQDEPPRLPTGPPAVQFPPGAMPGMTYRYEQAVRPLTQITPNCRLRAP